MLIHYSVKMPLIHNFKLQTTVAAYCYRPHSHCHWCFHQVLQAMSHYNHHCCCWFQFCPRLHANLVVDDSSLSCDIFLRKYSNAFILLPSALWMSIKYKTCCSVVGNSLSLPSSTHPEKEECDYLIYHDN